MPLLWGLYIRSWSPLSLAIEMCWQREYTIISSTYRFSSLGFSLFCWPYLHSPLSLILNIILSNMIFPIFVFLLLLESIESEHLVHHSCRWKSSLLSSPDSSLLHLFYIENMGECVYSMVRKKATLKFRLEIWGE